jgi:3-methyladenine DNA glycosylase Tag
MGRSNGQLSQSLPLENNEVVSDLHHVVENMLLHTLRECPDTLDLMNFYGDLKPENLTNDFILRELTWIAYAGGFRYDVVRKYWPKITNAFFKFDVMQVALLSGDLDKHAQDICQESGFKNLRKARWSILNAQRILELDCELREFGGLKGYFVNLSKLGIGEIVRLTPSILNQLKFKGIGQTTIFHLLKNMGIDIFKPDIHVCRILDRLGLIADGASIYEVCEAMRSLALSYNIKVSELDTLFFVYGKTNADFIPLNSFL